MSVETPFPFEGTITPRENGYGANLPCESEWLTETEDGTDYLQAAVDRAARKHGEGVEVRVRFRADRSGVGCGGVMLLGPVDDKAADAEYVLTDADGEVIDGERYDDPDAAVDARAQQMAEHPDGDAVTVEERQVGESA